MSLQVVNGAQCGSGMNAFVVLTDEGGPRVVVEVEMLQSRGAEPTQQQEAASMMATNTIAKVPSSSQWRAVQQWHECLCSAD